MEKAWSNVGHGKGQRTMRIICAYSFLVQIFCVYTHIEHYIQYFYFVKNVSSLQILFRHFFEECKFQHYIKQNNTYLHTFFQAYEKIAYLLTNLGKFAPLFYLKYINNTVNISFQKFCVFYHFYVFSFARVCKSPKRGGSIN